MKSWTWRGTIAGLARMTALALCLASTACYQVSPYKSWECHHSIPHVMEWRGNCVIYEAIVSTAGEIVAYGGVPWSVRMNNGTLNRLADEGKAERVRLQSGGALWLVETPWGSLRCVLDTRLNLGEIIVGRGWDVRLVGGQEEDGEANDIRSEPSSQLVTGDVSPDNDVEF